MWLRLETGQFTSSIPVVINRIGIVLLDQGRLPIGVLLQLFEAFASIHPITKHTTVTRAGVLHTAQEGIQSTKFVRVTNTNGTSNSYGEKDSMIIKDMQKFLSFI